MPAPFDFPFLPSVLPTGATGVSTGGDTAAPATDNATATGTSDFASLLSGALTGQTVAPNATAPVLPQTDNVQSALPVVAQDLATPAVATIQPPMMPVNTTLLQAQLPAAETIMAPQDSAQTVRPQMVPSQAVVAQTAEVASAEIIPTEVPVVEVPAIKVPAVKVPVADTPAPAMAQAEMVVPAPQAEPKAGPDVVQTLAPVMAAASVEPVVTSPVVAEVTVEVAPAVTPPVVKTVEPKPAKSKPVDAESSKTTVQTEESPAVTSDAAGLAIVASVTTPVTSPAVQPASQPVVAGNDDNSTPVPAGRQKPVAPQAPAPQNQADAADEGTNAPADNTQTSVKSKFASLLNAGPAPAPAANASAASKSQAPVTPTTTAVPSTPAASAPVQADAPQTAKTVEAVPTQKPAVPMTPVQDAPVQTAQIQTVQTQASQAQTVTRRPASAPIENKPENAPESRGEIASTPVAAAPSGFSLVSAPVSSDTTGYTPAATQAAPATSLLSQTAVDNINALSVQINRRHAEGATKFTMELHPADLGKVDVALSIGRDGKMTAHMTFDSEMTAASFSAHESELRQQLRDTGLQLSDDALSFSTRQKTDAVAQAQAHTVNANARSADDSSSGNSGQQQPQNPFTQADSQQGQQRPHSQHLAQMARSQAAADQAAADADLEALNSAVDLAAARLSYRQSSSRLALDLSV